MDFKLLLPEISTLALSLFIFIFDFIFPKRHLFLNIFSLLGLAAVLGISLFSVGESRIILKGTFSVDALTSFMRLAFLIFAFLIILASKDTVAKENPAEYYGLFFLSLCGALVVSGSADLIPLYLGLELAVLPTYVLVAFNKKAKSAEAALKYFLISFLASLMLLYGLSLAFGLTGETELQKIALNLQKGSPLLLATLFLLGGFGFKVAAFPFHFWAPDAYEGAPPVVAAYLASIIKLAAFAAFLRLFLGALPVIQADWKVWLGVLAVFTMVAGNLMAFPQKNIKRLLAYSSISQAGYALIGLGVATQTASQMMLFFLLTYGVAVIGAFLVINACSSEGKEAEDISDYSGLSKENPFLAFSMTVFLLSLVGIPPLAGFIGKFYLFGSAIWGGRSWLAVFGVLNTVISLGYYLKIIREMYLGTPSEPSPATGSIPLALQGAVFVALIGTVILGIYHSPFLNLAKEAARLF